MERSSVKAAGSKEQRAKTQICMLPAVLKVFSEKIKDALWRVVRTMIYKENIEYDK